MSKIDDSGSAFPSGHYIDDTGRMQFYHDGMSLRDWFAGQFLAGVASEDERPLGVDGLAPQHEIDASLREFWGSRAHVAYIAADAMLAARKGGA